jgi:2-aminoadipate transaminase
MNDYYKPAPQQKSPSDFDVSSAERDLGVLKNQLTMENSIKQKFSENFKNIPPSFIREILNVADQQEMISFAGGLPNPCCFPTEQLAESAMRVLTEQGTTVLQYAGSQGLLPLREWIAQRYNQKYGLKIKPENIVITNGSQQTLDVVSKMFIEKGDGIIVEKPTYLGAIQAMSGYMPNFLPVNLYEYGPDLKQIESFCLSEVPKFMYSIPNFQNPSGLCYNLESREKVADLLKKYGLLLLEDDPYNEIRFEGDFLPPIYSMAPENVFWSGSFSKMVAPGLRMGWVVLPDGVAPHFIKAKQSTDLHSNNLSQYVLYDFFTRYNIDDHLKRVRVAYKEQCDSMKEMISHYLPKEVKMTSPEGGMFLWLTLPGNLDSEELIVNCLKRGVAFVPGRSFFTNGEGNQNIRMNFSNSCPETIERGIQIMGEEMKRVAGLTKGSEIEINRCFRGE